VTEPLIIREVLPEAPPGTFSVERFERFCNELWIDSKEFGRMRLKWLQSQRYAIEQIASGLSQDIHEFVILKGRQMGISTVTLALDIYWLFKHQGLQAAVVTDTDENRELFRSLLGQYIESLPRHLRPGIKTHNRAQLVCDPPCSSRMMYMVAGTKKKGDLGRAKGVNLLHATECSSWGDEEGFGSLMNSLAQTNPNRLYVFESTARGFNMFFTTWEVAKKSKTMMAIFIGWWRNELYAFAEGSQQFNAFWDGAPTSDERVWIGEIFETYGVEITPSQLAWWRWYVTEKMKGDEMMALQEMPPTEDYAFQLSGSKFFSAERTNLAYRRALEPKDKLCFRYEFGLNFEDTRFVETTEDLAEVTLWETPVTSREAGKRAGTYVLGCDPAYGSSEWADEFAGCLLRCYADRIVQVAEIASTAWTEQQFAWVIAHMTGWFGDCMLNLEMQGPGATVYNELWNLKRQAGSMPSSDPRAGAFDVIGRIRDYLYKRQDSIHGNFAYQWQTNHREKIRMMSTLRSYFEREVIEINSALCLQQFRNIHRNGDQIGGEGRAKDDRVIALAIATVAWNDWVMGEMQMGHRTYERENRPEAEAKQFSAAERSVIKYLDKHRIEVRGLNTPIRR
jgi:hypothetical protein